MEPTYSIAEISVKTGLSYDTIRYYEKFGLLPKAKRKSNGQREFDQLDLDRLVFIVHLKRTNMPLKEIRRYMNLVNERDFDSCYAILSEHQRQVKAKIGELGESLGAVNYKLDNFHLLKKAASDLDSHDMSGK